MAVGVLCSRGDVGWSVVRDCGISWSYSHLSKQGCKDQESIQSSTIPDPGYQWESDKLTVGH